MPQPDLLFYDGTCGLCHGLVRFLARRHPTCRFAPLGGATFRERLPGARTGASLVVLAADRVLRRSGAVLHLLRGLGGGWALLATLAGLWPGRWLDLGYDLVARLRHRLFASPAGSCPSLPEELRGRLLP